MFDSIGSTVNEQDSVKTKKGIEVQITTLDGTNKKVLDAEEEDKKPLPPDYMKIFAEKLRSKFLAIRR